MKAVALKDFSLFLGAKSFENIKAKPPAKPLKDFKMEEDDSTILRYLYKKFDPKRHLEIGTWKGFGAKLAAENSSATVWTINPWEGEKNADGNPVYSEPSKNVVNTKGLLEMVDNHQVNINSTIQTDSAYMIGHMYREAGLGGRVNQIYATSKEWDTSNIPESFFDTILIDGSHEPELVVHDTRKTLPLLRSGGVMIWHDYCPVPEVIESMSSVRGVTQGIKQLGESYFKEHYSECFWIDPSWLLVGIKK